MNKFHTSRQQRFTRLLVATLSTLILFCVQAGAEGVVLPQPGLLVQTQSGPVRGELSQDKLTERWLGIPFAEPPIGTRRWQAPKPHQPWATELQANTYGAACPQVGWFYGPRAPGKPWGAANVETFNKPAGIEDCLKLNIWRPVTADTGLPVIVFVHGGSNIMGYSADPIYDGAKLAASTHAVIVTINYRLGIFGWFSNPALEGDDSLTNSGNFGTLDILQALKFVQTNATAFGGDARNITLMGQSAGGVNVYGLMGSPMAAGLFQKAIVLSGLIAGGGPKQRGVEYSKRFSEQLVIDDGLAENHEGAAKYVASKGMPWLRNYLKEKSSDQLLHMLSLHRDLWGSPREFNDGIVLSDNLSAAIEHDRFHVVPTIVGMTRDESKLLFDVGIKVSGPQLFTMMVTANPDAAATIKLEDLLSSYFLPSWGGQLYNSVHWGITTYLQHDLAGNLTLLAKHNPKVFAYRFDWNEAPEPWRTLLGAAHASDLPFVFGNFSGNLFSMEYAKVTLPGREALSAVMMHAIAAFVRTGDPNNPTLSRTWRPWGADSDHQERLIFNASARDVELSTN